MRYLDDGAVKKEEAREENEDERARERDSAKKKAGRKRPAVFASPMSARYSGSTSLAQTALPSGRLRTSNSFNHLNSRPALSNW